MSRPKDRWYIHEEVNGRLWAKRPCELVARRGAQLLVRVPGNSEYLFPQEFDRAPNRFLVQWTSGKWELETQTFKPPSVWRLLSTEEPYDIWFTPEAPGSLGWDWYVNFQRPCLIQKRTITTMDWLLDITIQGDPPTYSLKDTEEFEMAFDMGILSLHERNVINEHLHLLTEAVTSGHLPWQDSWLKETLQEQVRKYV